MRHSARLAAVVAVCGVLGIGFTSAAHSEANKVWICHGTASQTNPYVLISVDDNALAGHFDGTAPGHGPRNHPDILVTEDTTECPDDGGEPSVSSE